MTIVIADGRPELVKPLILLAALSLGGCAVNLQQNGGCRTPGASPFASNCPTADDAKAR
jgi:hypothetical protein